MRLLKRFLFYLLTFSILVYICAMISSFIYQKQLSSANAQYFSITKDILIVMLNCASLAGSIVFVYTSPKLRNDEYEAEKTMICTKVLEIIRKGALHEDSLTRLHRISQDDLQDALKSLKNKGLIKEHGEEGSKIWQYIGGP